MSSDPHNLFSAELLGGIRTECSTCRGQKVVPQPTMALINDESLTLTVPRRCPDCDGEGWFPGFQPPA